MCRWLNMNYQGLTIYNECGIQVKLLCNGCCQKCSQNKIKYRVLNHWGTTMQTDKEAMCTSIGVGIFAFTLSLLLGVWWEHGRLHTRGRYAWPQTNLEETWDEARLDKWREERHIRKAYSQLPTEMLSRLVPRRAEMRLSHVRHSDDVTHNIFFEIKVNRLEMSLYIMGHEIYLMWWVMSENLIFTIGIAVILLVAPFIGLWMLSKENLWIKKSKCCLKERILLTNYSLKWDD